MPKKAFPLPRVYGLLEPGPVLLVSTGRGDKTNIMTISWHQLLDYEPPLLSCVISEESFTFGLLRASGECVINIPTVDLAEKVVGCGNTSGRKLDKFKAYGLTRKPAKLVKAPMIDECFANLECRTVDAKLIDKYNLFILEVLQAWIDPSVKDPRTLHHRGWGAFMVAGETIKLPSRMR